MRSRSESWSGRRPPHSERLKRGTNRRKRQRAAESSSEPGCLAHDDSDLDSFPLPSDFDRTLLSRRIPNCFHVFYGSRHRATEGIGYETARRFVDEGATVYLHAPDQDSGVKAMALSRLAKLSARLVDSVSSQRRAD